MKQADTSICMPVFPIFAKLDINYHHAINGITNKFPPYSDFNFTSMYCWNFNGNTEFTILNNNLIIKLSDYIDGETIYSLIGHDKIEETADRLLDLTPELRLVPEFVAKNIKSSAFLIEEDRDNFDYIYDLKDLANLNGSELKWKRKRNRKFIGLNGSEIRVSSIKFHEPIDRERIILVFHKWGKQRIRSSDETEHELIAIQKLINNWDSMNLIGHFLFLNNEPEGFSIHEPISDSFVICHFQKTNLEHDFIDIFFSSFVANELYHRGFEHSNWEQDLGIEGLREMKEKYSPKEYLKKYTVKRA